MSAPITCTWGGESFVPLSRFAQACDAHFVVGERYVLVEHQERSHATHAHFFACVNEAWQNLPEGIASQFATADHLRRFALIKAGFHDSHTITCSSKAEARRIAAFIRPIDEFAVVTVQEATVTRYTAKSQSMRAMGREDFQRSKTAVLDVLAGIIGVGPETLVREGRRAAA